MAQFVKGGHLQPGSKQMPPFVPNGHLTQSHQAPPFGSETPMKGNALAMANKPSSSSTAKVGRVGKAKARIKIKASKRGTFTAAANKAGKSVQQEASSVLSNPSASPAMKKKANFARNAATWNH